MKIKLPSLQSLWFSFAAVLKRFPLQVLLALLATAAWWYAVDPPGENDNIGPAIRFICVSNLALTLLLSVDLYAEVNKMGKGRQWFLRLLAVLVCAGLYFLLHPELYKADIYRIALLAFSFHLLVAFAPFIGKSSLNGFWQYNKTLFLRFLISALYAGVLFAGLAIALSAINGLFNADISSNVYVRLFALVTAGFATVFFLAGLPLDLKALEEDHSYPRGLQVFTQYVLIPLMSIYLLILLVYEVKIALEWQLPKGMVSLLILGYSVFGILSLLLIYPIKDKEGNGWIRLFSKFFYVMMIPLVVLLLLAVWKRVGVYGITESRYILTVLAVWLTLLTAYFLLSRKQNIMMIPISLSLLSLLAVYGPQSAFSVSRYSQSLRLKKIIHSKAPKDVAEQRAVIYYLVRNHGLKSLQDFTKRDLVLLEDKMEARMTKSSRYGIENDKIDSAYAILKIAKEKNSYSDNVELILAGGTVVNVKGFDLVIPIEGYAPETEVKVNGLPLKLQKAGEGSRVKLTVGVEPEQEIDVLKVARKASLLIKAGQLKVKPKSYRTYELSQAQLSSDAAVFSGFTAVMVFSSIDTKIDEVDDEVMARWLNYKGMLLIRFK